MRDLLFGLLLLTITAPAFAQVPVYTNKDLGKPLKHPHKITPEEYRSVVANQFKYVPPVDDWRNHGGARVTLIPDSTPQPLAPYVMQQWQPLQPSWSMWSGPYVGYGVSVGGVIVQTPPAIPWGARWKHRR